MSWPRTATVARLISGHCKSGTAPAGFTFGTPNLSDFPQEQVTLSRRNQALSVLLKGFAARTPRSRPRASSRVLTIEIPVDGPRIQRNLAIDIRGSATLIDDGLCRLSILDGHRFESHRFASSTRILRSRYRPISGPILVRLSLWLDCSAASLSSDGSQNLEIDSIDLAITG